MNTKLSRVHADVFGDTLRLLGYTLTGERGREVHWRNGTMHLIVKPGFDERERPYYVLPLHRDAHVPYPPGHKAVFTGDAVEREFKRILGAYHTRVRSDRAHVV